MAPISETRTTNVHCREGGGLGWDGTIVLGWGEIGKGVRASKGFWVSASRL